jgi:hypothetical protein
VKTISGSSNSDFGDFRFEDHHLDLARLVLLQVLLLLRRFGQAPW